MKIETKKLHKFLKKCSLDGKIGTCIMRGDKQSNKISIKVNNGNSVAIFGALKVETDDFVFPIKSTKTFLRILDTFSSKTHLEKQENILKIYDEEREANIVLADEDFIDNDLKEELKFTYEGNVAIKAELFKNSLRNTDIVQGETLNVEVKNNILSVSTGKNNFDKMIERCKVDYKDCKNELGGISFSVIQVLEDDLKISMKTNYPIRINETNENMNVIYFVAPLEQEENENESGKEKQNSI